MNKFTITISAENGQAKVDFNLKGQQVKGLFAVNFLANTKTGELELMGQRFKTNEIGKFFVDESTKDTAIEGINLLSLLENSAAEQIEQTSKELMQCLQDIKDTSTLRARNLIAERLS